MDFDDSSSSPWLCAQRADTKAQKLPLHISAALGGGSGVFCRFFCIFESIWVDLGRCSTIFVDFIGFLLIFVDFRRFSLIFVDFFVNMVFGVGERPLWVHRIHRKRCHRLLLGPSLPHAPGARMTVVTQTPSNDSS